jgi:hypothetical protein
MKLSLATPLAVLLLQTVGNPLQQQKPTGSIEGTITRAGSTQPVANARVTVTRRGAAPQPPPGVNAPTLVAPGAAGQRGGPALPPIPAATTDDKGRFVVAGLEDGTFNVNVQANGYVAQPYGQKTRGGPSAPVNVNGGQPTKGIDAALIPAATISGRIHDPSDQPLINVSVQLLRYSYDPQGQRSYQPVGSATTDDRGEYRIYWVTPGRYYLLAGKPSTGSNSFADFILADFGGGGAAGNEVPRVLGFAFYPGVQEIANARTIDLQPGTQLQSVDMTLAPKPRMFKIRGTVVDSRNGQAPPRASVFVAPQMPGLNQDDVYFGSDAGATNYNTKTGTFEIRDLLPGTYSVVAMVTDNPVLGRPGPVGRSSAMTPIAINSADVDNVTISVVPAGAIPGRVRVDGQLPAQMTIERMTVQLTPIGGAQNSLSGMMGNVLYQNTRTNVAADGTFRLVNIVPGDYRIDLGGFPITNNNPNAAAGTQFMGSMQTANAYIKDARLDGNDALNAPVRFSGSVSNGLEIVLAFGSGRVEGAVTDSRSQSVAAGRVVAVPDRMRFRTDMYRTLSVDLNGRFTFPTLPPGDYKIYAWESIEDNGWFDPDLLSRSEGRAVSVHVTESSTQTVNVQITPAEAQR